MNDIRLIALDMDGTLLDGEPHRSVSAETAAVLRRAQDAGIRVVICSGRLPGEAILLLKDAGLELGCLGLNGSCWQESLSAEPESLGAFSPEDGAKLLQAVRDAGLHYGLYRLNSVVVDEAADTERIAAWSAASTRSDSPTCFRANGSGADALTAEGLSKMIVVTDEPPLLKPFRKKLDTLGVPCSISSSWENNYELNPPGVDKGTALTALAARFGLRKDQVMAIGDHDNDVEMLKAAGFGVVMGGGSPAATEAANWVTLTCARHGVAAAVRCLVFGEDIPGVRAFATRGE